MENSWHLLFTVGVSLGRVPYSTEPFEDKD